MQNMIKMRVNTYRQFPLSGAHLFQALFCVCTVVTN